MRKKNSPVDRQDSDAGSEDASVNASGVNVSITEDPVSAVTWDAEMGAFQPRDFHGICWDLTRQGLGIQEFLMGMSWWGMGMSHFEIQQEHELPDQGFQASTRHVDLYNLAHNFICNNEYFNYPLVN